MRNAIIVFFISIYFFLCCASYADNSALRNRLGFAYPAENLRVPMKFGVLQDSSALETIDRLKKQGRKYWELIPSMGNAGEQEISGILYKDVLAGHDSGDVELVKGKEIVLGSNRYYSCTFLVVVWTSQTGKRFLHLRHDALLYDAYENALVKVKDLKSENAKRIRLIIHSSRSNFEGMRRYGNLFPVSVKDMAGRLGLSEKDIAVDIKDLMDEDVELNSSDVIATSEGTAIIYSNRPNGRGEAYDRFILWEDERLSPRDINGKIQEEVSWSPEPQPFLFKVFLENL